MRAVHDSLKQPYLLCMLCMLGGDVQFVASGATRRLCTGRGPCKMHGVHGSSLESAWWHGDGSVSCLKSLPGNLRRPYSTKRHLTLPPERGSKPVNGGEGRWKRAVIYGTYARLTARRTLELQRACGAEP